MPTGYLTRYASHALLTLMTGGGEDSTSGTDQVADTLLHAHLMRHWNGGAAGSPGVWAPKAYLLSLMDQVDAQGSAAVRTTIEAQADDPPAVLYLALCTSDPGDVATSLPSEVTASGYQRQSVLWTAPKTDGQFVVQTGVSSQVTLSGASVFGPFTDPTGSGGPISHMALVTAATGSTLSVLAVWPLDAPTTAEQGDSLLAADGSLTIKVN